MSKLYDCSKCPGYCCSYPVIEATQQDIRKMAKRFGLTYAQCRDKYTDVSELNPKRRQLKKQHDQQLNADMCQFFDLQQRRCTIYMHRPKICRSYPGDRCEWHDRRMIETMINKRKVIILKKMPSTIDGNHPEYDLTATSDLLEEYLPDQHF